MGLQNGLELILIIPRETRGGGDWLKRPAQLKMHQKKKKKSTSPGIKFKCVPRGYNFPPFLRFWSLIAKRYRRCTSNYNPIDKRIPSGDALGIIRCIWSAFVYSSPGLLTNRWAQSNPEMIAGCVDWRMMMMIVYQWWWRFFASDEWWTESNRRCWGLLLNGILQCYSHLKGTN